MENMGLKNTWKEILDFYKNKNVFVTGFTGFKGSWLCHILKLAGANVIGYALKPEEKSLYYLSGVENYVNHIYGDIRNYEMLKSQIERAKPELVFHLAAQPIVLTSYRDPVLTYETNVMGTVYLLDAVRGVDSVRSVINITTDKVYENKEWQWGYRECDTLNGYDPYSNSKSCSEIVTDGYRKSFFEEKNIAVSTMRAGNVIGGGDFSENRIIPDCIRAAVNNDKIKVRNPYSVRPYQHVLEPLFAYLLVGYRQYLSKERSGAYNVGPEDSSCITTGELVSLFCDIWGQSLEWETVDIKNAKHEANFLKLDCSRMKNTFGWKPRWDVSMAVDKTIEWTRGWLNDSSCSDIIDKQIKEYMEI